MITFSFACLVIVKSPFPKSVKQHTKSTSIAVEDPTIVQLIYSPRSEIRPLSKVKAGLVFEDYQSKRGFHFYFLPSLSPYYHHLHIIIIAIVSPSYYYLSYHKYAYIILNEEYELLITNVVVVVVMW